MASRNRAFTPRKRLPGIEDSLLRDGGQMASCSSQSLGGAVLFLGWHLIQTTLSTTVIPLCGVNKTENCVTTVGTVVPITQVGRETECKPEWRSYCFNGDCRYSETLDRYYCRCKEGWIGERCSHSNLNLVIKPLSNEYLAFTILLCLFFFSAILLSIYFYRRYLNKKERLATSKNYKEVATDAEKDQNLLHV
ncbi:proepiregulin [Protobothrops mucrosquamatus]|uniref:proepiregulin n=1 Tax=Protobothrops mucrosquamatus TaxID=103944 RepID=UPI0010FBB4CD|nr:proepiregulin [Protobothrops mucrosquamatus]